MINSTWPGQKHESTLDKTRVKNPLNILKKKIGQNKVSLTICF